MPAAEDDLELLTLTRLWLFPRYLYRWMDRPLASPWNLRVVAWSLLLFPPLLVTSLVLGASPGSARGLGALPSLFLPGLLVWLVTTRVSAGAQPLEVGASWLRLAWHSRRRRPAPRPLRLTARSRSPRP